MPRSKFFLNPYLVFQMVLVLASCSIKKKRKKYERNFHGDNIESSSTRHHGKCSQCPAFKIKQNPSGRSPEDHQVRAHDYLPLNKAQSCSFICSCMLWFECVMHNTFVGLLNQALCLGQNVFFGQTDMVSSLIGEPQS